MLLASRRRFDESYQHGFEDIALCGQLEHEGLEVLVVPAARCVHVGGASLSRASPAAQRHAVAGHLRLVGGGWRTPVVVGLALAPVLVEGGPWSRVAAVGRGVRDYRAATGVRGRAG